MAPATTTTRRQHLPGCRDGFGTETKLVQAAAYLKHVHTKRLRRWTACDYKATTVSPKAS